MDARTLINKMVEEGHLANKNYLDAIFFTYRRVILI